MIRCKRGVKSSCSDGKGGKFAGGRANQPHVHYYDKRGDRGHVKIGNDKYDINDAYQVREAFRVVGERKPPNQVALQQEIQKVMKSLVKIGASGAGELSGPSGPSGSSGPSGPSGSGRPSGSKGPSRSNG